MMARKNDAFSKSRRPSGGLRAHAVRRVEMKKVIPIATYGIVLTLCNTSWARELVTEDGYTFNIEGSYVACDGGGTMEFSPLGSVMYLEANWNEYRGYESVIAEGRTVDLGSETYGGNLVVRRVVTVPETGGNYARVLDIFENTSVLPDEVSLQYTGFFFSEVSLHVWGSSSGDEVVDETDSWYGIDDLGGDDYDGVAIAISHHNSGILAPSTQTVSPLFILATTTTDFSTTLDSGERIGLLHFVFQGTQESIREEVENLIGDVSSFVDDMDSEDLAIVVNWSFDIDEDGFTAHDGDCDDFDDTVYPGAPDTCDGLDNDCDGDIDEESESRDPYYPDRDGDGFGDDALSVLACVAPPGFVDIPGDCDDTCEGCYPGADERCDGIDNDCDSVIDNDVVFSTFYRDLDGDGYGASDVVENSCEEREGWSLIDGDCDDTCDFCYPGADELCDEIDNNCDETIDEGVTITVWRDNDGDGFGLPETDVQRCEVPIGYVTGAGDCDDLLDTIHPDAVEVCDGVDNNCDGEVDEGQRSVYYLDSDGDGFGDPQSPIEDCEQPGDAETNDLDCDDTFAGTYPGANEIDDGFDNDCDGLIDEGFEDQPGGDADSDVDHDGDAEGEEEVIIATCSCRAASMGPPGVLLSLLSQAL